MEISVSFKATTLKELMEKIEEGTKGLTMAIESDKASAAPAKTEAPAAVAKRGRKPAAAPAPEETEVEGDGLGLEAQDAADLGFEEEEEKPISQKEVLEAFQKFASVSPANRAKAVKILTKYNVKSVAAIPEDKRAEAIKLLK